MYWRKGSHTELYWENGGCTVTVVEYIPVWRDGIILGLMGYTGGMEVMLELGWTILREWG